jgi:hypothetical protein
VAELVSYQLRDSIAVVTLDDGKVNVLSRQMLRRSRCCGPALSWPRGCCHSPSPW